MPLDALVFVDTLAQSDLVRERFRCKLFKNAAPLEVFLTKPILCTLTLSAALWSAAPAQAAAACNRECLKGMVDLYLDSLGKHDPSKLPLAPSVKFTENGVALKLGEGFWKTAGAATYRLYALDPASGGAALEAVVGDAAEPAHFLLRLKVENSKISEIETAVVHKGKAGFYAPERLTQTPPLYTEVIPKKERATREQLIAAADGYFTAIETEGTPDYKPAPFAPGVNRFENGVQTTNVSVNGGPARSAEEQFQQALFKGITATNRRYPVVDVEHGIVLGIVLFHGGRARPTSDMVGFIAEMFKITDAKIREIQAVIQNRTADVGTGWN
jgi:hypothetical protein